MNKFHFKLGDSLYFFAYKEKILIEVMNNKVKSILQLEEIDFDENYFSAWYDNTVFDFNNEECDFKIFNGWGGWEECLREKISNKYPKYFKLMKML